MSNSKLYDIMDEEICCCSYPNIIDNGIEFVCVECGTVIGQILIAHEKRAFNQAEIENRRHHETKWREFGNRTSFIVNVDGKGNPIKDRSKFNRLQKIQVSLINSKERNLWESTPKFKEVVSKLHVPDYINKLAWKIYNEAVRQKLTMGRTIDGFVTASFYAAIRVHDLPILLEEVNESISTSRHNLIASLYLLIQKVLPILKLKMKPLSAKMLVYKFGNGLKIPLDIQTDAGDKLVVAFKKGLKGVGRDPKGFAVAILYILTKHTEYKITQKEFADLAKVTEVTLRSRVAEIRKILNI